MKATASLSVIISLSCIAGPLAAQTCVHTNLSKRFDYEPTATHINHSPSTVDSADVTLVIRDKKTGRLHQKLSFGVNYLYEDVFKNCGSSRSYITGYHENSSVPDYDYGDFIVADLNFDGQEDLAIKKDSGGNGGPVYNFYLQNADGYFGLDNYLTTYVGSFPKYINSKKKTLTTQIHANVHKEGKKTFKYNSKTKKWRLIQWAMVNFGQ